MLWKSDDEVQGTGNPVRAPALTPATPVEDEVPQGGWHHLGHYITAQWSPMVEEGDHYTKCDSHT